MLKYILAISAIGFFSCESVLLAGDEHAFISMFERRQQAWDEQQADELANDFQSDGVYFDIDDKPYRGNEEIKAHYNALFKASKKHSFKELIVRQRFITQDIAIVDAAWGLNTSDPKTAKAGNSVAVIHKIGKSWKIAYLRHYYRPPSK